MDKLVKWLEDLIRAQKKSRAWRTFVSCLAAIVVFTTTYSLILPAITVESTATEDVGGLVMEGTDAGSTGAQVEAPGEVVTVDAENEIPEEPVQEEAPVVETTPAEETSAEETAAETPTSSSETGTAQPAASQPQTAETAESAATVTEEVREPVNGEVQTIGDKRVMTLKGDDFDVVVSGDLSVGVSDRTVLSVRGIADADVVKSFSDRISDELLKIFVDTKTTEVLYQLVFTDENLVEYTPAGYFDVQFIFHRNTVSHTDEKIYAAIYDYLTDEMVLAEKNGDEYETPVISLDEYGIIKGITLKGMHFDEYSDIITLVAGPVNEELKLAAEKAAEAAATESKAENAESADSKAEKTESTGKTDSTAKTESTDAKTDSSESKAEGPTAKAETSKGSETAGSGTLTARGSDYTVTLAYGADAKIPDGATLEVSEIENGTKAYKKYLKQAKAAMGLAEDQELPKEQARFFDIKIVADGKEVQPSANVSVNITYDQPVVEAAPNTEAQIDASAVHFGKKGAEVVEVSEADASGVEFKAESFSVYGVIYTVDFQTVDGGIYSIPGEGAYKLNDLLLIIIGKEGIVSEASLQLIDGDEIEGALYLTKREGEWYINSDVPFESTYELAMVVDDVRYVVRVTDAASSSNLADFLVGASINAPKNSEGKYVVAPDTSYAITLNFQENKNLQYANGELTYDLKDSNLDFSDGSYNGTFSVTINDGGTDLVIKDNTFTIDNNGMLKLNFNSNDPNYDRLLASANVKFHISFEAEVKENVKEIKFTEGIVKEVEIDTSNSVTPSKSATFNKEKNTVDYTVAIVSEGKSKNIEVKDTISDSRGVLSLDASSIQVTSSTGKQVSLKKEEVNENDNSFDYIIDEMTNGEVVTFKYSAKIDLNKIPNVDGKYVQIGNNKVEVHSEGDPTPKKVDINTTIDYTPTISKGNATVGEDGKTLTWSITANPDCKVSMAGGTITDTIRENSRDKMSYSGTTITVNVFDSNNDPVRTETPEWNELENHSDYSWTYKVPQTDVGYAYKYVITYTTKVNTGGAHSQVTVNNDVETNGGKHGSGSGTVTPSGGEVKVYKNAQKVDLEQKEITWEVSFNVPAGGFDEAYVLDKFPNIWLGEDPNKVHIREVVKEGSVKVSGLLPGETYDVVYDYVEHYEYYDQPFDATKITFYKDSNKTPGLNAGSERTIIVTLKTPIDPRWLESAKENTGHAVHRNDVELHVDSEMHPASEEAVASAPKVEKTAKYVGTRTVNGIELPVYRYEVVLVNVTSDTQVVEDNYETSLLEPLSVSDYQQFGDYNPSYDNWFVFGGGIWSQDMRGSQYSHVFTDKGMIFTTSSDCMPHNPDDSYYVRYKLVYYLTVKDEQAMKTIMGRADQTADKKYSMNNTVNWNGSIDDAEVTYEYPGLNKEILNPNELDKTDTDIYAKFRITVNPGGLVWNNNEPLTLTDEITNLAIDYNSIQATPSDGVTWDQSNNVTTFTIPDATKVIIEYRARVLFKSIGDSGETIDVTFSNKASINGYEKTIQKTAHRTNSGHGAGSVPVINLLKYEAGDMTKPLQGAVFQLYNCQKDDNGKDKLVDDGNGNMIPVIDLGNPVEGKINPEDESAGPLQFVTGTDGKIKIQGDQAQLGWALEEDTYYFLKETVAPEGYMLADFDYIFRISSDGTTDYDRYIYHTGDIMSAKNYPGTDVSVEKKWLDEEDNDVADQHSHDTVTVKLQQKIGNGKFSDDILMQVKNAGSNTYTWQNVGSKKVTLDESNEWKNIFKSLPLKVPVDINDPDGDDVNVEYQIVETLINGVPIETIEQGGGQSHQIVKEGNRYSYTVTNKVKNKFTDFKFSKKWRDINDLEISWDQDIQVTVGRKTSETTTGDNFSLVYDITKSAVENATSRTVEFTATGGTATTPKLKLTIVEDDGKKYYNFKIDNLESADEGGQKYTYYAEETNSQLEFYLAPMYSNASAPTGVKQAYDGGTIINKKEGGVELPHTGGPGTRFYYSLGIAFIAMAGIILFIKRKEMRSLRGEVVIPGDED